MTSFYVYETRAELKKGVVGMTMEELQTLKKACNIISNLAVESGYREGDPFDPYRLAQEALTEVINRWEVTP